MKMKFKNFLFLFHIFIFLFLNVPKQKKYNNCQLSEYGVTFLLQGEIANIYKKNIEGYKCAEVTGLD